MKQMERDPGGKWEQREGLGRKRRTEVGEGRRCLKGDKEDWADGRRQASEMRFLMD